MSRKNHNNKNLLTTYLNETKRLNKMPLFAQYQPLPPKVIYYTYIKYIIYMHIIYNWSNSAKRINRSIAQRVTSTKQKKLSHSFIGPGGRGEGENLPKIESLYSSIAFTV